jgi:UDP-N-acetyl-D-mannosaminuronate dehydrogenase
LNKKGLHPFISFAVVEHCKKAVQNPNAISIGLTFKQCIKSYLKEKDSHDIVEKLKREGYKWRRTDALFLRNQGYVNVF